MVKPLTEIQYQNNSIVLEYEQKCVCIVVVVVGVFLHFD